jgi:hypothetical protein
MMRMAILIRFIYTLHNNSVNSTVKNILSLNCVFLEFNNHNHNNDNINENMSEHCVNEL